MSTSVKSDHPISFSLLNDDDQSVLDIVEDAAEGRNLKLEITNSSAKDLQLVDLDANGAGADKDHFHFELKFRRGVLDSNCPIALAGGDGGWLISKPTETTGAVSLYLWSKKGATLPAGSAITLTLQHISAYGQRSGARGTRVELKYQNLRYASGDRKEEPVAGEREQHLSIVNQRGKKNVPLHFGVVGSSTILNDGRTANDRRLEITNTLKNAQLPLSTSLKTPSRFILSFDVYDAKEQNDWALGTSSAVQAIEIEAVQTMPKSEAVPGDPKVDAERYIQTLLSLISPLTAKQREDVEGLKSYSDRVKTIIDSLSLTAPALQKHLQELPNLKTDLDRVNYLIDHLGAGAYIRDTHWKVVKEVVGTTAIWTITPIDKTFLEGDESIQLRLTGVISAMRSGPTNVYLRYENIPGYWDGQFITTLEKTNLVQRDQFDNGLYLNKSNVGIGTTNPQQPLTVPISANGKGISLGYCNTLAAGQFAFFGQTGTDGTFNGGNLTRGSSNNGAAGMALAHTSADDKNTNTELAFVTNNSGIDSRERMRIDRLGNVGIGTAAPISSLHIRKDAQSALGPILTLMNGSGMPNAGAAIDFDGYDTDTNTPTARLQSLDDGHHSSHFAFLTKKPGDQPGDKANDLIERLRISSDGNVGIGTTNPQQPLTVPISANGKGISLGYANTLPAGQFAFFGQTGVDGTFNGGNLTGGDNGAAGMALAHVALPRTDSNSTELAFVTHNPGIDSRERMRIDRLGNVGIGTTSPRTKLDVADTSPNMTKSVLARLSEANDSGEGTCLAVKAYVTQPSFEKSFALEHYFAGNINSAINFHRGASGTGGKIVFATNNGNEQMTIAHDGRVGIGTTRPDVPLEVATKVTQSKAYVNGWALMSESGRANEQSNGRISNLSIKSAGDVQASNFFAVSDRRIKNIEGRSDGAADLATLSRIEITDYTFKDEVASGSRPHKKAIAQQVEKVYPQAVSQSTAVVPDIYQPAPFMDGWVELATDLKMGERVRLIADKAEGIYEVLEVAKEKFRTDFKPEGDKVFVFGREVDDFRTLDYDAISMLNVSATQQLKKEKDDEVNLLRAEITDLKSANDALQQRLTLLESKFETAPSVVVAKSGSNGNGTH